MSTNTQVKTQETEKITFQFYENGKISLKIIK